MSEDNNVEQPKCLKTIMSNRQNVERPKCRKTWWSVGYDLWKLFGSMHFSLQVRLLPALAFAPPEGVVDVFTELVECEYYVNEAALREIIDYFEDVWIGRLGIRARRPPMFPLELWNCFDAVEEDLPRTNNAIEDSMKLLVATIR